MADGLSASTVVDEVIFAMCGCLSDVCFACLAGQSEVTSFFQKCTTLEHQLAALRAEAEGAGANQLRWGDEDEFATPARGALVGAGQRGPCAQTCSDSRYNCRCLPA